VSPLTVRTQVKTVLRKLGVTSQLAAVAAFRRGTGGV
jgi:DNA-binding CsgD family transcriptional regulator